MAFKIFASVIAALLLALYVSPVVVKLKDVALSTVVLIGLALMAADIWQAIRSKED